MDARFIKFHGYHNGSVIYINASDISVIDTYSNGTEESTGALIQLRGDNGGGGLIVKETVDEVYIKLL